ncbi:MAG: hypothetical protein SGJ18_13285 [Pseudomonadota bacterium]|nr:hypothetical protein [Pseudomonadota bacterium]
MKLLITLLTALTASQAMADGFTCKTYGDDLTIKVYNKTQPSEGTRNAAVMVISDSNISYGRRTIAKFSAEGTLDNSGASYTAGVDLRRIDSDRKGENILGTKLGNVDSISLDVDFKYNEPVAHGTVLLGRVTIEKRNGDSLSEKMDCVRYLKSE